MLRPRLGYDPAMSAVTDVEQSTRNFAQRNSGWVKGAARAGYVARGVLWSLIGLLALRLAFAGSGGKKADKSGALQEIGSKPFGKVLLILMAVACALYAAWHLLEAALNFEDKGVGGRIFRVVRAVIYISLVSAILRYALSKQSGNDNKKSEDFTEKMLDWPLGAWLVAAVGLALIGAGLYNGRQATGDRFKKHLECWNSDHAKAVDTLAKVGLFARMLVFVLVGGLFIQAAVTHDKDKAGGLDAALRRLIDWPFGRVLLGALAVGLIAFGLYSFAEAKYRRIETS
jgi:hypothetical protein